LKNICIFISFIILILLLSSITGCSKIEQVTPMKLCVENQADQLFVVTVEGISFGEIPPGTSSVFLVFERYQKRYILHAYTPTVAAVYNTDEAAYKHTYQNKELVEMGRDAATGYGKFKLVIPPAAADSGTGENPAG
jgi:hypothetical protein